MSSKGLSLAVLAAQSALLAACFAAGPDSTEGGENTESRGRPIIGGTAATAFPEAVLVDMKQNGQITAACSGSLIAPRVVLTAGHCVYQYNGWNIKAPFANNQAATATSGATYDWTNAAETVNPNMHDIGLIFLDQPISISTYPTIATSKVADNSQVVNIGRIGSGILSNTT